LLLENYNALLSALNVEWFHLKVRLSDINHFTIERGEKENSVVTV